MTEITIPPEAVDAGARADYERWVYHCTHADGSRVGDPSEYPTWEQLEDDQRSEALDRARATFNAIVKAWEGMGIEPSDKGFPHLILPLPQQEKQDDKA